MNKKKKVYLDALRIIAAGCVIYNHLPAINLFTDTKGLEQCLYMIITLFIKIAVPIFFMISGALLLNRNEESYEKIIKTKFFRILLVIFIFELGLYILSIIREVMNGGSVYDHPVRYFIQGMLEGSLPYCGVYWYLYIYLGYLLSLPFMQRIAPLISKKDFIFILAVHFIFSSFMPIINIWTVEAGIGDFSFDAGFDVPFANKMIFFYPFMGYYIDQKMDMAKFNKKTIWSLLGLEALILFINCFCIYHEGMVSGEFQITYTEIFNYAYAIITFILIKYLYEKVLVDKPYYEKLSKFICFVGPLTFGIYLLDPYMGLVLTGKYFYIAEPVLGTFFTSVTWVVVSMTICSGITFVLKKLPVFKKIL